MINYESASVVSSVLHHYKTRLVSSYENKLFWNVFSPGVIPETGSLSAVDVNGIITQQEYKYWFLKGSLFSFVQITDMQEE